MCNDSGSTQVREQDPHFSVERAYHGTMRSRAGQKSRHITLVPVSQVDPWLPLLKAGMMNGDPTRSDAAIYTAGPP
jgi:hypothetical protein